jgi:hypothetical protein
MSVILGIELCLSHANSIPVHGVIDMVRVLVEIYHNIINALITDENSWTAYHYACLSGMWKFLLISFDKFCQCLPTSDPPQSFQIFLNGIAH